MNNLVHPDATVQSPIWNWRRHVVLCLRRHGLEGVHFVNEWILEYVGCDTRLVPRSKEYRSVLISSIVKWWKSANADAWKSLKRQSNVIILDDCSEPGFPPTYFACYGILRLTFPLWWYDDPRQRYRCCGTYGAKSILFTTGLLRRERCEACRKAWTDLFNNGRHYKLLNVICLM